MAQNENLETAQNETAPCCTENIKPEGKAIKLRKTSAFRLFWVLFYAGKRKNGMLARCGRSPCGNQEAIRIPRI